MIPKEKAVEMVIGGIIMVFGILSGNLLLALLLVGFGAFLIGRGN
jgi:hypothetical protein